MGKPVDQRGVLDSEVFTYKSTKDQKVFLFWRGKLVTTLSGCKGEAFISDIKEADEKEAQLVMAKATGHFKHGNEKQNKRK